MSALRPMIQSWRWRLIGCCATSSLIPDADHLPMALSMVFALVVLGHHLLFDIGGLSVVIMVNITEKIKEYGYRNLGEVQC